MQFIQQFPFIISFVIYIENIFSQSILTESLKFYVLKSVDTSLYGFWASQCFLKLINLF